MKLVWVVRLDKQKVIWDSFQEAWQDYLSHEDYLHILPNPAWIYPRLISDSKLNSLPEHKGW
jgi:hypothetical protein